MVRIYKLLLKCFYYSCYYYIYVYIYYLNCIHIYIYIFIYFLGMPQESSAWEQITVVNLKNNKIADIGTLPVAWPLLERLFLGYYFIYLRYILCTY